MSREYDIEYFDEIDSTNNEAKRRIEAQKSPEDGHPDRPFVLVAHSQTAGRGRQGKDFYSPKGTGIYLTVVCPMNCTIAGQVTVTTKTAVAVSRAIESFFGIECAIKWVNDIYVNDRKCCGILCEAVNDYENNRLRYVIIGVGVNVYTRDWPKDIAGIAGSIRQAESSSMKACKAASDNAIMSDKEFTGFAEKLTEEILRVIYQPDGSEYDHYRSHSCVIGHEITFSEYRGNAQDDHAQLVTRNAKAVDIDENGGLIVELETGERRILDSGEITIRRV
ncbi:MAG: biotin--[acetyl-CoA-carboxylase] ligase [Lachnospiraceae bacterium]|nr:biotin--[acetyl-CoA-carboxylase] ligase [Lachnospiraceae bacterium]